MTVYIPWAFSKADVLLFIYFLGCWSPSKGGLDQYPSARALSGLARPVLPTQYWAPNIPETQTGIGELYYMPAVFGVFWLPPLGLPPIPFPLILFHSSERVKGYFHPSVAAGLLTHTQMNEDPIREERGPEIQSWCRLERLWLDIWFWMTLLKIIVWNLFVIWIVFAVSVIEGHAGVSANMMKKKNSHK